MTDHCIDCKSFIQSLEKCLRHGWLVGGGYDRCGDYESRDDKVIRMGKKKVKVEKKKQEEAEPGLMSWDGFSDDPAGGAGGWLKFGDGDEKEIKLLGPPEKRLSNYQPKDDDAPRKYEYVLDVEVDDEEMKWSVTANSPLADDLKSMVKKGRKNIHVRRNGLSPTNTRYAVW